MNNNYSIYKFTFSDGKIYIGQTSQNVEDRWKNGEGYQGQEVYVPIVLEGWNNIQKEILHTNLTSEQADKLEKYYIKKFNSQINGYNRTAGGKSNKQKIMYENTIFAQDKHLEYKQQVLNILPYLNSKENDRVLMLEELKLLAKTSPNTQLIKESQYGGISYTTAERAMNMQSLFSGYTENYIFEYLILFRVWQGNPTVQTILNTPWPTSEMDKDIIKNYDLYFITDKKIKQYYIENNEIPDILKRQFKNYQPSSLLQDIDE